MRDKLQQAPWVCFLLLGRRLTSAMAHRTSSRNMRPFAFSLAIVLGFSAPALGADPSAASKERARELMAQGRKARADADWTAALQSFIQADQIMHVPTTGLEVAKTFKELGRLVEAADMLDRVAALPEAAGEPEVFASARRAAHELRLELDARIPRLRVTASPEDASGTRLSVDGKPVDAARAAEGLRVDPGRHVATAERAGAVQQRVVQLLESGSAEVTFELVSPATESALPERVRQVKTPTSTYVIYGLTGLAVAGIGTGIGLGVWANQRQSALETECAPRCADQQVTNVRIAYVAANVTTAIGVASGLGALGVYFLRSAPSAPQRETARSLAVAVAGPGVTVFGSF